MSGYVGYLGKYRHQNSNYANHGHQSYDEPSEGQQNPHFKQQSQSQTGHQNKQYRQKAKEPKVIAPQFDVQRLDAQIEKDQFSKSQNDAKSCKIIYKKHRRVAKPDASV